MTLPKPTALKILEGNPGKRPLNKKEPKPRPLVPTCPDWLNKDAKAKWAEFCPLLDEAGILTQIDGDSLAQYCMAWIRLKRYIKLAAKSPPVFKAPSGYLCASPLVSMIQKEAALVNRLAAELGLTPSSRSRLTVPDQKDDATGFFGY